VENPVVQLVDETSGEILYTVRVNGKTFSPGAPKGRAFTVRAGRDQASAVILEKAQVGGSAREIRVK
jgi:hypothetical protein